MRIRIQKKSQNVRTKCWSLITFVGQKLFIKHDQHLNCKCKRYPTFSCIVSVEVVARANTKMEDAKGKKSGTKLEY